jgi:hypothetical protein
LLIFQLMFKVWFIGPFPKICLGWSTFGTVQVCSLEIPDYNFLHTGHITFLNFFF